MSTEERRNDKALDANLSVLGDEGKEPHVGRVGSAPRPTGDESLGEALDKGEASPDDGNLDETSQKAAKDSIGDVAGHLPKS